MPGERASTRAGPAAQDYPGGFAPIASPYAAALLSSLQYQRRRNDCGPYTVATVIHSLTGQTLNGGQLAREMNRPAWRGLLPVIRRIPNWATFPWGMVDVFQRYGLQAAWRPLASISYLHAAMPGSTVLLPIVGEWRPLWSHVMALVQYDPFFGWGFANTQRAARRIDWVENSLFRKRWRAMGRLLVEVRRPA